jgi:hypothetical protein
MFGSGDPFRDIPKMGALALCCRRCQVSFELLMRRL